MASDLTVLVLMCYYERPNMVTVGLHSLLAQTYGNWRLAFVDDGSVLPGEPVVIRLMAPEMDRVTLYSTGDCIDTKIERGGSRLGEFWNRALKEIPADLAIMLCDDDALLPDYFENLNPWFQEHEEHVYCHSHVRCFDPFELTDLASIEKSSHWLNRNGNVQPSGTLDSSQVAWRTKCNLEGDIWFPSPRTDSLDRVFYADMHARYGDCPFSRLDGQYKGAHPWTLSSRRDASGRRDIYGSVKDLDQPYDPPL